MPKISVIIPVYNVENYVGECLDSVLNQTFKDIEVICVNDCSTDKSLKVLKKYQKKDKRIIIINNKKNQMCGYNRNFALKKAKGEYIYFLDSDDFLIDNNAFEKCINLLEQHNLDCLVFRYISFNSQNKTSVVRTIYDENLFGKTPEEITDWKFKIRAFVHDKMYKKSFLLDNNICFAEGVNWEDTLFMILLSLYAKRVMYIEDIFSAYRKLIDGKITNNRESKWRDIIKSTEKTYQILVERGIYQEYKHNCIVILFVIIEWLFERVNSIDLKMEIYRELLKFINQLKLSNEDIIKIGEIKPIIADRINDIIRSNCMEIEQINCCGCAACANICPKGAIKMLENKDGFYVPHINKNLCINCGLCEKTCPQINDCKKYTKTPDCYAVMANDEIRKISSSGGAFTVFATEILNRKGIVCGAAFDENWTVKHIIVDNEEDLAKLRGSKYVQSFVSETLMKDIKKYLEENRWVLFTGTPCQIAGLRSFLQKDYETLLCVDIVCSKVPPKKVFDKFLDDNADKNSIKNIKFRDKANGWCCSTVSIDKGGDDVYKTRSWFRMYLNSLCMNESCVSCKYMSINRASDITIGDFWGIEKIKAFMNDQKGTSLILINNKKAKEFFKKLNWQKKEPMTCKNAIDGNRALFIPFEPHQNRKLFMKRLETEKFDTAVRNSLSDKYNVGILNWWWNSNRGAVLTCYAIQEVVKELGYNPSVIKHIPFDYYHNNYPNSISEEFANKYLNLTEWCHSRIDMRRLNEKFDTFMVGSDQVWNHKLNWFLQDFYYLNFAELDKNIVSCAASFGGNKFTGNAILTKMVEYYFKRFNAISVREQDAVPLLKEKFGVDGTWILDPVFLINKDKYEDIVKTSLKNQKGYIAYYFINSKPERDKFIKEISKKLNKPLVNIKGNTNIQDWLYYIKNADFVVSDSFHASCFSIMFNKKFITLHNWNNSRFDTLGNITHLEHRFRDLKDYDVEKLDEYLQDENWQEIEDSLKPMIDFSINWLKEALENKEPKPYSKELEYLEAFYASMDDRLNMVEGICSEIQENQLKEYKRKYKKYKILSKITIGNLRKRMKDKRNKYKQLINS